MTDDTVLVLTVGGNEMQSARKLVMLALFLSLTGCVSQVDYMWKEYPIKPDQISSQVSFAEGRELSVIKGKSDKSRRLLGSVPQIHYYGNEQSLTDAIVNQLSTELQQRRVDIKTTARKSLEITVTRAHFKRGFVMKAATLEFTVKRGNGMTKSYSVRNSSPASVYRAYNGAVALAVIQMINEPEVLAYIKE